MRGLRVVAFAVAACVAAIGIAHAQDATTLKKTMPGQYGFNPADCNTGDCKMLANAMQGAGKLAEMKMLVKYLGNRIAKMEETAKQNQVVIPMSTTPDSVKLATEQANAESRENRQAVG